MPFNLQLFRIGSVNVLAPNKGLIITWTNYSKVRGRHMPSLTHRDLHEAAWYF